MAEYALPEFRKCLPMLNALRDRVHDIIHARTTAARPASDAELALFREQGYFVRERLFSRAEVQVWRNAVESIHQRMNALATAQSAPEVEMVDDKRYQMLGDSLVKWEWREGSTDIRSMEPFLFLHPDLENLIDDPRLWQPAQSILGVDGLALFTDKLNFKRPGGAPFPMHQDSPYFALDGRSVDKLLSLQIYLDDVTVENGCLWMVPGSHLHGILPGVYDKGVLDRLYTDMERYEGAEPVPVEVPAGSVIFFHAHVIHGSKGNRTNSARRAMVITYQPAGNKCWKVDKERPIHM